MTIKTKQFTVTNAGPRQTKKAAQALQGILDRGKFHIELTGVQGANENRTELWTFGAKTCDDALKRFETIGEKFNWEISKANFKQIEAEAIQAAKDIILPVVDNRRSPEQEQERLEDIERNKREREEKTKKQNSEIDLQVQELREKYPNAKPEGKESGQARAAANIRMELKTEFPQTKFSVRSRSASMMNAVDVYWTDGPTADAVDAIINKYQTYAGMDQTDYAMTKSDAFSRAVRIVLGSAKYVSSHRKISDEIKQAADAFFTADQYDSRRQEHWTQSEHLSRILHSSDLRGSAIESIERADNNAGYVVKMSKISKPAVQAATSGETYNIVKQHHTKKQIDFFIAVPVNRMERELYLSELDRAKTFGGWKSRKWGSSPSGYGFETREAAEAFTGESGDDSNSQSIDRPGDQQLASKFEEMAEQLTNKIEDCRRPLGQNWTPKRGRELNSRQREGRHLERTQKALLALAELHSAGELPGSLASFRTKAAIYKALGLEHKRSESDCYEIIELPTFHDKSPEAAALQDLIAEDPAKILERQRKQELQSKIDKLRLVKEPGFFPTPKTLANRMVEMADIQSDDICLEPSAGIGTLADLMSEKIKQKGENQGQLHCIEQKISMADICKMKGHVTTQTDFMEWTPDELIGQFDKIVMNPPFEKQQDVKHICRAFEMLAPGGRLVALCSGNVLNRSRANVAHELQSLVNEYGTHNEQIDGAFKGADSFKQTGVSVLLIVLEKPSESLEDLIIEVDNGRTCLTNEQAKLICGELLENEEKYNQLLNDAQHVYNVVSDILEVEPPQDIDGRDRLTWDLVNPPRNDKDGLMNFVKMARTECEKGNAAEAELILVDLLNDLHSEGVKFNWS